MRTSGKTIPVLIVVWAILFNLVNAGLNGYALGTLYIYRPSWLIDPRFLIGLALFLIGAAIVIISGGIDLSPGAVIALTGVVAGELFVDRHWGLGASATTGFLVGSACGLASACP